MRLVRLRGALGALALVALACVAGSCRPAEQGAVEVAVIGSPPTLADPAAGPLDAPSAVLLASAAQGLVRFDARGQIEPGLAERWNVSDDGLSYIFRLHSAEWPGGGRITAEQVARSLRRQLAGRSDNPLKDSLGAVSEIVAMTDRVIEIRLNAARPNLLQLLAQPEMAVVRDGRGAGPFATEADPGADGQLRLSRSLPTPDSEEARQEEVRLRALPAADAVGAFARGEADLVLGGSFVDLPHARAASLPDDRLQFDPVAGLFGLVPNRSDGPLADPELRRVLSEAIDRDALLAALDVPGLAPRATILEPGLEGLPDAPAPAWLAVPIGDRRPDLIIRADRLFGGTERPTLRLFLPEGPGAAILLRRLANDWGLLGIAVERAPSRAAADLLLVDEVAPSAEPAWFLRRFRCEATPLCDQEIDELLEAARAAPVAAQRSALLAEAARRLDEQQMFLPITAPIRWSLVAERVVGFAGNRFARHTLTSLDERPERQGD